MNRPESRGHRLGDSLPAVGRALRWSAELEGGAAGEIWRLPAGAERLAERLLALGRRGVGGFTDRGADESGPWLARRAPATSLAEWMEERREPVEAGLACALVATLAEAAAACEEAALFPGPLDPGDMTVRGDAIELRADALVAALVGGAGAARVAARTRWLAPEQAAGQPADGASNRYAIGLLLYRLLAGEHPFSGRGLRHGLDDQAVRGAPPLPEPVAARLPPGLHSTCLRLLDPDPARRPSSAAHIAAALRGFAGVAAGTRAVRAVCPAATSAAGPAVPAASPVAIRPATAAGIRGGTPAAIPAATSAASPAVPAASPAASAAAIPAAIPAATAAIPSAPAAIPAAVARPLSGAAASGAESPAACRLIEGSAAPAMRGGLPRAAPGRESMRRWLRVLAVAAPVVAAAVGAVWTVRATAAAPVSVETGDRAPLGEARSVADCASCHPRHTAEWSRSVMAHAGRSPLFQALEILIEEQVGRDRDCPGGAGILRAAGPGACRSRVTGLAVTGSGGELWCVNCHTPGENLARTLPAWNGVSSDPATRRPLRDLLPDPALEGIGCATCHQAIGPSHRGNQAAGLYEGNPSWLSADSGRRFLMRPEDERGLHGIANSGYFLDPSALAARPGRELVRGGRHAATGPDARRYLASSEFCGACHDVRLFGSDALTGVRRGEHFKRLRNAYSEWAVWRDDELRAGRVPASCQDCHMSLFPGVCVPATAQPAVDESPAAGQPGADGSPEARACPPGTAFSPRPPGSYPRGRTATGSPLGRLTAHTFSGVDVPLSGHFESAGIDDVTVDVAGVPLGARQRRDLLLARTFRMTLEPPRVVGGRLEAPIVVENVGAGHRVPAGFSQEREFWIHLVVKDARGRVVYEVGRVDRGDEDLRDKVFLRIETSGDRTDGLGRPIGLFGADIADGPDLPEWSPPPILGGSSFRGRGLINFQNGFLRCVRCIGTIDSEGRCQPGPGQEGRRAARYADGDYDVDTGRCRSNLSGFEAFFETFFPVGSLDAERGLLKGPDAIIDTRSAPPGQPLRYVYDLDVPGGAGPFTVEARLLFRAFPPFLLRAFIDYEASQDRRGLRPSGPLIDGSALERLDVVEIAAARVIAR